MKTQENYPVIEDTTLDTIRKITIKSHIYSLLLYHYSLEYTPINSLYSPLGESTFTSVK
jgi:hypothetical protein